MSFKLNWLKSRTQLWLDRPWPVISTEVYIYLTIDLWQFFTFELQRDVKDQESTIDIKEK